MNAALLLIALAAGQGRCSDGSCSGGPAYLSGLPLSWQPPAQWVNPPASPVAALAPAYEWGDVAGKPDWWALRVWTPQGYRQVGAMHKGTRAYQPLLPSGDFGPVAPPPHPAPAPAPAAPPAAGALAGDWQTSGVDLAKLSPTPAYSLSGNKTTSDRVFEAIGGTAITDDSKFRRFVVTHPDEVERKRLAPLADKVVRDALQTDVAVKVLDPKSWLVADYGYKPNPDGLTLYLVQPSGREIWRIDRRWPDADELAAGLKMREPNAPAAQPAAWFGGLLAEGLRGSDPKYDPTRSSGIRPKLLPNVGLGDDGVLVLVILGVLGVAVALKSRSE